MTRVLRAANEERRGETFFARAKGDVRQKWLGATDGERRGEKYFARAKNDVGQKWLCAAGGERRGEKYFARAKGDVRQKQTGGYAPPMADVRAKIGRAHV